MRILFDPKLSEKGAMLCVNKQARKVREDDFELQAPIYAPD